MLHVDIPTADDLKALINSRDEMCVSIYSKTTAAADGTTGDRIEFKNAAAQAISELKDYGADKRRLAELGEELDDLVDDDDFWRFQAHSLAVFATPENVQTFRLPNALQPLVAVSDRFHLKPLLRAITFPNACYVLALSEGATRLVEVSADLPAESVKVEGMPGSAAGAAGKSSLNDRSPSGRIQGSEGQKVRLRQFARKIDQALRPLLAGSDIPLVLAANEPLNSIYRSVNTYPHLAQESIGGSPEALSDAQLAQAARPVLDGIYRDELADWTTRFQVRSQERRTLNDVAQAARAATAGAIDSMLVNMDEMVHGTVDADGAVTFTDGASAGTYGVVDEIATRVILTGGKVLAVRENDIPQGSSLAAILRYAM